jgi:hypothetical protein
MFANNFTAPVSGKPQSLSPMFANNLTHIGLLPVRESAFGSLLTILCIVCVYQNPRKQVFRCKKEKRFSNIILFAVGNDIFYPNSPISVTLKMLPVRDFWF